MLLNCDLGESFGNWKTDVDRQVMPYIDMANIACGFHAGDPVVMLNTVKLAQYHKVQIGAHPSYPDLQGFGRRSMQCTADEVTAMVLYQLGALSGICQSQNTRIRYVKPHGALYNDMMKDSKILHGIFSAINQFDSSLPLMIMATANNQHYQQQADNAGISLLFEAFADRAYDEQGFLVNRQKPGAVYHDTQIIKAQAISLTQYGTVNSLSGKSLQLNPQTLCVHGDNAESVTLINELNKLLRKHTN